MALHVLGVDPGYRNLGLAVTAFHANGDAELVWTDCLCAGNDRRPLDFPRNIWPTLKELEAKFNIEAVFTEVPPYLSVVKTSALVWSAATVVGAWAADKGIPYHGVTPVELKKTVAKVLGQRWTNRFQPTKGEVGAAAHHIYGSKASTSHENDAALVAYHFAETQGVIPPVRIRA